MKQLIALSRYERIKILSPHVGRVLLLGTLGGLCWVCWRLEPAIEIHLPWPLVCGALFLLLPFENERCVLLQWVCALYLLFLPVNQLSHEYIALFKGVQIAATLPLLSLCVVGHFMVSCHGSLAVESAPSSGLFGVSCLLAVGLLALHMLLLGILTEKIYGYGWEGDFGVLGHGCLYLLLIGLLGPHLKTLRFRQVLGAILTLFYLGITFAM